MAILNISEAARSAGVARSTIQRAIREGRLSATRHANGSKGIDTSELVRVFGELHQGSELQGAQGGAQDGAHSSSTTTSMNQPAIAGEATALQAQVDLLQEQLDAALEREQRLLRMIEDQQQRLLPPTRKGIIERLADAINRVRGKS